MPLKIIITDCSWGSTDIEKRYLPPDSIVAGYQCRDEEEVIAACKEADAILSEYAVFTERVLKSLNNCKIISNTAIGVDNIDIRAAQKLGIVVANVPGYCVGEVADHTMALILAGSRNIVRYDRSVRNRVWDINCVPPMARLAGQVLGLIGLGAIAQYVAARANGFGLRVIAYDPFIRQKPADSFPATLVPLEYLLAESDIISLHLPLHDETAGFLEQNKFSQMKKKPLIINTSRGRLIKEDDLITALTRGEVRGAALDVLPDEPPSFKSRLFEMENVIITPHAAFYSQQALEEVRKRSALNITNFYNGDYDKINIVNSL